MELVARVARHARQVAPIVLALPIAALLRLLRPLVRLRIGRINAYAIGHFAIEPDLHLTRARPPRTVDVFYFGPPVVNDELAAMWGRALHVWRGPGISAIHRASALLPGHAAHTIEWDPWDRDGALAVTPSPLAFTDEQVRRAHEQMAARGIPVDRPWVCIYARDEAYRAQHWQIDMRYHGYRNSAIADFAEAARQLADAGFTVIRIGNVVAEPFDVGDPRVVDYSAREPTALLDVFLVGNAAFVLGGVSGIVLVAALFRRPLAWVNVAAVADVTDPPMGTMFIPKVLETDDGALPYGRATTLGVTRFSRAEEFAAAGVRLRDNTPEEIAELAEEMRLRRDGTWVDGPDDEALQDRFWAAIGARRPIGGTRVGAGFLRRHADLLD